MTFQMNFMVDISPLPAASVFLLFIAVFILSPTVTLNSFEGVLSAIAYNSATVFTIIIMLFGKESTKGLKLCSVIAKLSHSLRLE